MDDRSVAEFMAELEQVKAEFFTVIDDVLERNRIDHAQAMTALAMRAESASRPLLSDPLEGNPYDMDADEIWTTNEPTVEVDE